tara:strand:- start:92 stop:796 length:705 start_codon:yes stop_codon:yes gene_type:complete
MKKIFIKYIAEFLVVFLGILLSFAIDNKLKLNSEIENKNQLLSQLSEIIEKDLEQLKVIDSTLVVVENSLDYLTEDLFNKRKISSNNLVLNFQNISSRMSLSFFPNSGIYNEIISIGAMKLIRDKSLRTTISLIYEHNTKRSQAVNRSLDDLNEEFNRYFYPYIQFRTKNKDSKTIYSDTELTYYKVNSGYYTASSALGFYTSAKNFVSNYRSLLEVFKSEYLKALDLINIELK